MDPKKLRKEMGDRHEEHVAEVMGGRKTRGSGNQFNNPMDGRNDRYAEPVAFAWDAKSSLSKSISVTQEMWAKAVEQAHGERPMLGIRFYFDERLQNFIDLALISLDDLAELREGRS
jgi:hypothetical protein